jgi:mycothiol synthase
VHRIEIKTQLGQGDVTAVRELLDAASAADAHAALDEHAWVDLVQGGREGFAGLVAWEEGHDHPVGYAQVSRGEGNWALEFVVDPHHRTPGNTIGVDLVRAAAGVIAREGGGHVHMWVNQPRPEHNRIAAAINLTPGRVLYQMRRPLPVEDGLRTGSIVTRPFRVGQDEDAWLEVNNRAFHWHPEQGGWDRVTLQQRESEPWFDPAGFLLHEDAGGKLDGFCWTKIHKDTDPPLGEIYVIAVDPERRGNVDPERRGNVDPERRGNVDPERRGNVDPERRERTPGLGRHLVIGGLDYLFQRGLTVGMLYVDAGNAPAVKLYVDLSFVVNHLDQAYVGDIPAAP